MWASNAVFIVSLLMSTTVAVAEEEMPEAPGEAAIENASPADEGGSAPSGKGDSLYDLYMTRGIVSYVNEDYAAAEDQFRAAMALKPDSFEATLHLGIALSRQLRKEAEYVIKKALYIDPEQQRATFELGLYYFKKGIYPEAMDFFEITADIDPGSTLALEAVEYMKKIHKAWSRKRWSADFQTGFQYDTNVALSSSASAAAGTSGAADFRNYLTFDGGYDFYRRKRLSCNAGYSFYRSMHLELSDYDMTAHDLTLRASYDLPREALLDVSYSYGFTYIGGNHYSATHALRPSLLIPEGREYSAVVQLGYTESRFDDSELFKFNSERSGRDLELAIVQYVPIAEGISLRLGYAYDSASAKKDYWSRTGNRGFISNAFRLPYGLKAELAGEYRMDNYEGDNPQTGERREDRIQTYRLGLEYAFSERIDLSARQIFIVHGSNIDVYDYDRAISSLSFSLKF